MKKKKKLLSVCEDRFFLGKKKATFQKTDRERARYLLQA
jgi:hypothetical protein